MEQNGEIRAVVIQRGYITKKTRRGYARWLKRYWSLYSDGTLMYHSSKNDALEEEPSFMVNVTTQCYDIRRGAEACDCAFPSRVLSENCFGLATGSRVFYLYTDSADSTYQWMDNIGRLAKNMISANWNFSGAGSSTPVGHRLLKQNRPPSNVSVSDIGRDSGIGSTQPATALTTESPSPSPQPLSKDETDGIDVAEKEATRARTATATPTFDDVKLRPAARAVSFDAKRSRPSDDGVGLRRATSFQSKRESLTSSTSDSAVYSDSEMVAATKPAGTFKIDTKPRKKTGKRSSDGLPKQRSFLFFGRRKSKEEPKKENKVIRASTESSGAAGFIKYRDADGVVHFAQVSEDEEGNRNEEAEEAEAEAKERENRDPVDEPVDEVIPEEDETVEEKVHDGEDDDDDDDLKTAESPSVELDKTGLDSSDEAVPESVSESLLEDDSKSSPVKRTKLKPADSWIRRQQALSRNLEERRKVVSKRLDMDQPKEEETPSMLGTSLVKQSPFLQKSNDQWNASPSQTKTSTLTRIRERGDTSESPAVVKKDLVQLIQEIRRLGKKNKEGRYVVAYEKLFCEATAVDSLSGTLKSAKRQQIVSYEGELLLHGTHNTVLITLLKEFL